MRQKNDLGYAQILNDIRIGNMTEKQMESIQNRIIPFQTGKTFVTQLGDLYTKLMKEGLNPVCIFPLKKMCKELSEYMINQSGEKIEEVIVKDTIDCQKIRKV